MADKSKKPVKGNEANKPVEFNPVADVAKRELQMLDVHSKKEEMDALKPKKIGEQEIAKATQILRDYKKGKKRLETKLIADEQFWKLRQWDRNYKEGEDYKPATAWLWSCIQSRYSDVMDSYPTCNFRPRQADDKAEAKKLSAIVPVILEQNRFEETYSDFAWYMLKHGGGVLGVFWDKSKHNGLGDISVKKIDFMNLFWESGITDIQDSENVFNTELVSNRILEQRYPQCQGKLNGKKIELAHYIYDDEVDTKDKSVVVDWYYHTEYNGKKTLQYCKFVNDIVLYATENETADITHQEMDTTTGIPVIIKDADAMAIRGLYEHAMYPFIVQQLFPIEGSLCGYGLTDIGRDSQMQIDSINKAITENTVVNASPRYFAKDGSMINEEEFLNQSKPFVHVAGNLDDVVRPIDSNILSSVYVDVLNNKIEELKYVTSNQDSNNGIVPSGVTAASAIAALQETAGKNARSSNKAFYRAYRDTIYQIVELIRQFYDIPRTFRIAPDTVGSIHEEFTQYSNEGLKPQAQIFGNRNFGFRKPEFDIEVTAEKASPYKKMEQNELALNFYAQGFFNPQMADQALACLQMMDFSGKEEVMARVQANGTMQQLLLQYQQIALKLAAKQGDSVLVENLSQAVLKSGNQLMPQGGRMIDMDSNAEHPYVENAREQARESTQVDN